LRTGAASPPKRIRAIAADLARVAFDEEIELDREWTDFRGKKHAKMVGRPVSFHAMRGISAHSNGFQTCRALHVLQILLGSVETPGGMRFKPPYPKPATAHPKPHGKVTPGAALDGPHLGFVHGPEDLLLSEDGTPRASTRPYMGKPDVGARADAYGHLERARGRSVQDRHAVHVYGQHVVELFHEHRRRDDMLTDTNEDGNM